MNTKLTRLLTQSHKAPTRLKESIHDTNQKGNSNTTFVKVKNMQLDTAQRNVNTVRR